MERMEKPVNELPRLSFAHWFGEPAPARVKVVGALFEQRALIALGLHPEGATSFWRLYSRRKDENKYRRFEGIPDDHSIESALVAPDAGKVFLCLLKKRRVPSPDGNVADGWGGLYEASVSTGMLRHVPLQDTKRKACELLSVSSDGSHLTCVASRRRNLGPVEYSVLRIDVESGRELDRIGLESPFF